MYHLIATTDRLSKISDPFEDRHDCIEFARDSWKQMKRAGVKRVAIHDTCDGSEDVLFPPATPHNNVPAGFYAHDEKRYELQHGTPGTDWEGWTFLKTGSLYNEQKTVAMVKPDGTVVKRHRALFAILADPVSRGREYAAITEQCFLCGMPLENDDSKRRGCGPKCAKKLGIK